MNKHFLFLAASFVAINLVGCQQIQTVANSTVGTISKGVSAYDGWVSKGTQRVWDEMSNKDIRNKFLVLSSRSDNNVIILNQSLINDKFKLEKRTMGSIHLEKYINLSSMKYFSFLASFGTLAYLDLSNKPLSQP